MRVVLLASSDPSVSLAPLEAWAVWRVLERHRHFGVCADWTLDNVDLYKRCPHSAIAVSVKRLRGGGCRNLADEGAWLWLARFWVFLRSCLGLPHEHLGG